MHIHIYEYIYIYIHVHIYPKWVEGTEGGSAACHVNRILNFDPNGSMKLYSRYWRLSRGCHITSRAHACAIVSGTWILWEWSSKVGINPRLWN